MNIDALLFMLASWLSVASLTFYCFAKLMKHRHDEGSDAAGSL